MSYHEYEIMSSSTTHLLATLNMIVIGVTLLLILILNWLLTRVWPNKTSAVPTTLGGCWAKLVLLVGGSLLIILPLLDPGEPQAPKARANDTALALTFPLGIVFFLIVLAFAVNDVRQRLATRRKAERRTQRRSRR